METGAGEPGWGGLGAVTRWRERALGHWADPLYRQSYYMLASTGVSAASGLLFWVMAARRARPDAVGVAAGMVAAIAFLSYLTSFALPYAMLRFGGSSSPVSGLVNASLAVSAATSLLVATVFAGVSPLSSPALAPLLRHPADIGLFALAGAGVATSLLVDNLLAARRRAAVVLARSGVASVVKLVMLLVAGADDPRVLYLAATLPALVTTAGVLVVLPRLVPGYRRWELRMDPLVRQAGSFALRTYPGALLSGAPQFALPVIVVAILPPRQNAFFYVGWSMAQILYLIPTVISNIALSQGGTAPVHALVAKSRRFSLILLAPFCAAGTVLAGRVLGLYGTAYVHGAAAPLRLLVLAALPWSAVILAQARLRIEHHFRAVTLLTGCFCVASLGLPLLLAPTFAVTGIAAGWLLAVVLAGALAWWLTPTGPGRAANPT